jgi:hypothetical protein
MAKTGKADREHSGHYLTAVAAVTVVVAGLAWFSQNWTLAAAAAALGLYALHLVSIRFLLDNQRRQRQMLDAQWEVLQQFIGASESSDSANAGEIVPAMPVDREDPEKPATATQASIPEAAAPPAEPVARAAPAEPEAESARWVTEDKSVVVPPVEALSDTAPARSTDGGVPITIDEAELGGLEPVEEPEFLTPDPGALQEAPGLVGIPSRGREPRPPGMAAEVPVPRHFALGTVALVRDLLSPAEVAQVLLEQRRQPGRKFGELAVELGLLSESQREELLLAQQEGLFTDGEMREARRRLREFRENAAHSMASLD